MNLYSLFNRITWTWMFGLYWDLIDSWGEILVPSPCKYDQANNADIRIGLHFAENFSLDNHELSLLNVSPDAWYVTCVHLTRCLVTTLLDLFQKSAGPKLLLLQGCRHQEHLLGCGGVIANFTRGQPLPRPRTLFVKLHPTTWRMK